jgi:hypothetical protein
MAEMSAKDYYYIKRINSTSYEMVANKEELNPSALPGGRPQIVWLRLVNFDIDGCVSCSCELLEMDGIVCRHILAIIQVMDETMCDIQYSMEGGSAFQFWCGNA